MKNYPSPPFSSCLDGVCPVIRSVWVYFWAACSTAKSNKVLWVFLKSTLCFEGNVVPHLQGKKGNPCEILVFMKQV